LQETVLTNNRAHGDLTMTDPRPHTAGRATLSSAEPQLIVSDITASSAFYTRKLGFTVAFAYGEPPFYVQVFRDGARLNLRHLDTPPVDRTFRDREQVLSATITLDDADPLFAEHQAAGVVFAQPLRAEPWDARTFIVRDPDGNLILFAGRGEWLVEPIPGDCRESDAGANDAWPSHSGAPG
jgi:catechol 2,3-dioxygenase-like lactoylglutathione lyase family enzyme